MEPAPRWWGRGLGKIESSVPAWTNPSGHKVHLQQSIRKRITASETAQAAGTDGSARRDKEDFRATILGSERCTLGGNQEVSLKWSGLRTGPDGIKVVQLVFHSLGKA